MDQPPPADPSPLSSRPPTTAAAFVVATVLAALAGVYGPLVILFPWMWNGGTVHPVASVLVAVTTPACWLGWHRLVSGSVTTRSRHLTVLVSGALTLLYGIGTAADLVAGSLRLWTPSLLVGAVGYALVTGVLWRRWRVR